MKGGWVRAIKRILQRAKPAYRFGLERGSASTAIGALIFLPILAFGIGAMRIVQMNGDVSAAARFSARSASASYQKTLAEQSAQDTAEQILEQRGLSCVGGPTVVVTFEDVGRDGEAVAAVPGYLAPGGLATVEITCVVDLSQSLIAGFPGTRTITVEATSKADVVRGGGAEG